MASINKKVKEFTHEGGKAVILTPEQQLRRSVMACLLWENSFYEDGVSIAERIASLVKVVNPGVVKNIAIEAKHRMKLRHIPLYLTVLLSENGFNIRNLVPQVVNRLDDLGELLALYRRDGKVGKKFTRSLLKGISDVFTIFTGTVFNEYHYAKYKGNNKGYSMVDVINLTHPKPKDDLQKEIFAKIVKGTLTTPDTWEVGLSACETEEDKKKVWEKLISENKLGGLATLRNIRNMEEVGVSSKDIEKSISKINDPKLLPINFITSAEVNPKYESLLEEKFIKLFTNKEKINGKTVILVDVSGSMEDRREKYAGGLAMIARELFQDVDIRLFGTIDTNYISFDGFIVLKEAIREHFMDIDISDDIFFTRVGNNDNYGLARYTNILDSLSIRCNIEKTKVYDIYNKVKDKLPHTRLVSKDICGFNLKKACMSRNEGTYIGASIEEVNNIYNDVERLIVITDEQTRDNVARPKAKKSYIINVGTDKNGIANGNNFVSITGFSDSVFDYIIELEGNS